MGAGQVSQEWQSLRMGGGGSGLSGVKIGKILAKNRPKAMIPSSKNKIFQKFFNCLVDIELRESRIENRGLFSYQIRR